MKTDDRNVSRRNFLAAGVSAAAASSIIVIETQAAPGSGNMKKSKRSIAQPLLGDPVYTTDVQTLTNKTISSAPSAGNTLGTDYVNVREFPITGTDITVALNDAINSLKNTGTGLDVPRGGQILIPRGRWTSSGGHDFYPSISIEGVGTQMNPSWYGVPWGTEIKFISGTNNYMFKIEAMQHNCSLKNMSINLGSSTATGLLMTDGATSSSHLKFTSVENVTFEGGDFGIKVVSNSNFECILNRFERVCFAGCRTSFFCNTVNSGFLLDTCYFLLHSNGVALNLEYVGNISVEHCLFVPIGAEASNSTVLKTVGAFGSISFYDCQDEGITYAYQNSVNFYDYISIVYRNCLIQSKFKFTAPGSVVLDSCRVASFPDYPIAPGGAFEDSPTAYVKVYLKGQYNFFSWTDPPIYAGAPIAAFVNPSSQIILEKLEIGSPEIIPVAAPVPAYYVINKTRGLVSIGAGSGSVSIYNNLVGEDSLVFAQLQSYDPGGVKIREVLCSPGAFQINLTAGASNKLRVAFKVEI